MRWLYTDNSWSGDIETDTIPVTLTIPETVTLSLDAQTGAEPATLEVLPGAAVGELPVPEREGGWVFLGWYTAPAATAFEAGTGTRVTA